MHESGRMSGTPCVTDAHASDLTTATRFVQFKLHYFISFNFSQLWFLWQHPRVNHLHTLRVDCVLVHITSHLTQHLWVERSSSKPYPPSLVPRPSSPLSFLSGSHTPDPAPDDPASAMDHVHVRRYDLPPRQWPNRSLISAGVLVDGYFCEGHVKTTCCYCSHNLCISSMPPAEITIRVIL